MEVPREQVKPQDYFILMTTHTDNADNLLQALSLGSIENP